MRDQPRPSPAAAPLDAEERRARAAFDRARSGEPSAFGEVVRVYHARIYNAVFRLLGDHDDAAEVTQDAFAKAFERLASFRGDSGPYTWLFRIANNAAITRIRRGKHRRAASLDAMTRAAGEGGGWRTAYGEAPDPEASDPRRLAEADEDRRAVADALGRLDAEYRSLLVMRDLEGFDYKQMAALLDLPLGTLKSRLFRARVALRELLQDHFEARRRRPGE